MRERIKQVMARTFQVPVTKIPDDASIDEFPAWDSLGHLEFMLALEMEFAVTISTEDILELLWLDAVEDYLKEKGVTSVG
jgi:acyl carrier protein